MDIGNRISVLRKQSGLTQEELGSAIGLSREHIGRIEKNKAMNFSVQSLVKICETLNITPSEFFNEENALSSVPTELRNWQRVGEKLSPEKRNSLLQMIDTLIDE